MYSTKRSILAKFYNFFQLNKKFHKFQEDEINRDDSLIISPVEAKLVAFNKIDKYGRIISKLNKKIFLKQILGSLGDIFSNGFYMNFYLGVKDKHYWRVPYDGKFVSAKITQGKTKFPIFMGLEKILKNRDFFTKAIKRNASIGSILLTKNFPIAMVAVGSLNVNYINFLCEENKGYRKGEVCGYFNLGSSMLLCFPNCGLETLVKVGDKVDIGDPIVKITNFKNS